MLRLEGTAVDDLLPDAVVGGEIDVFEKLPVDERVDLSLDVAGIDVQPDGFLGVEE